jgi:PPE-repeat protein
MVSVNFATLPPEINSGRMSVGPGSGPMTEAAAAWDKLAARLYARLADYRSVTSKLAAAWQGAATRYIDWLDCTAARAAHAATQAAAAARAFESALATLVPLPVVEANRAQRASLASTNCLGQFSSLIADLEAEYDQMWVQDAAAMNAYADASADAVLVTPFSSPTAATSPPEVISAGQQVMSAIPQALQAFSASPLATVDASLAAVTSPLSKISSLTTPSDFALTHLSSVNKAAALHTAASLLSLLKKPGVTGGARRAASIGTLSVPRAWTEAAPAADLSRQAIAESRKPS